MKAIITVVGKDKSGIVAGVSGKIAELGLNIFECKNQYSECSDFRSYV
ncbi:TPA: hypothetical protein VZU82_000423 [Streptococcus pneumoniae]|nr:hypothetical protein [Streptococcus pneumoniae]HEW1413322.1 hypothetical protein [Streptococcus pneumoniae]